MGRRGAKRYNDVGTEIAMPGMAGEEERWKTERGHRVIKKKRLKDIIRYAEYR